MMLVSSVLLIVTCSAVFEFMFSNITSGAVPSKHTLNLKAVLVLSATEIVYSPEPSSSKFGRVSR